MLLTLASLVCSAALAQITPQEQARFDKAADYSADHAGRAVLIMRAGTIIYERYDHGWTADKPHPLASGTKSFTGVAAMIAVQEGLISLDELVCDTLTEWKEDPKKSKITVRHLLTLSSGLQPDSNPGQKKGSRLLGDGGKQGFEGLSDRVRADDWWKQAIDAPMTGNPGAQFRYGGNHYYAFGAFLDRKLAAAKSEHKDTWSYYQAKILDPIGCKGFIGRDNAGHPNLPGGALFTAREWAKFGQLVLNQGTWTNDKGEKKEIIKPEFLKQCFEPSKHNPSYGLTWWLQSQHATGDTTNADTGGDETAPAGSLRERLRQRLQDKAFDKEAAGPKGHAPDGNPITVYMAAGLGKQRLYVLPQFDMVVVRFAEYTTKGKDFDNQKFLAPILNLEDQLPAK